LRVNLPSGDFIINGIGSNNQPVKQNITVSKTSPGSVNLNVEGVVADDIVKSSN
jgi:hypothetical protein